ncbi:putative Ig domain-containing protein [Parachlamydia sp. AcF125]|uniref:putative Ig domain-containing protein n=1 Tax=Parachlamydia sp. AcF125 TaxID=2795736 RepID=UPI001BC949DD|nr:putative Ig domain-containing protein [Parachlamydia sp. AcF125]MBS4168053.1 hypothetical protein [Parachlamydia sp. AcF125]
MHNFFKFLLFTTCLFGQISASLYGEHSKGRTQNNFIPNFKVGISPRSLTQEAAVAFVGEVGRRNYRANGTLGWLWGNQSRFKFSAEFLSQKLGYRFSTGKQDRWMHQYAVGAEYQHDFYHPLLSSGEIGLYYSYAPSRKLGHKVRDDFLYSRRIAGSDSYGGSLGATVTPWRSGSLHIDADYDSVRYRTRYKSKKRVSGFGGSLNYHQDLSYNFFLDLLGEFKRPYNYGRARLGWHHPNWAGLVVGLFGAHTRGKSRLPSHTTAGLELTYAFGERAESSDACVPCYCEPALASWVSTPAVYMPQVLAIAEEKRKKITPCQVLTSSPIPDASFTGSAAYTLDISPYFSDPSEASLTFSATGLPLNASLDAKTGVISGTGLHNNQSYSVTITAKSADACASVSQTFTLNFPCEALESTPISDVQFIGTGSYSLNVSSHFSDPAGAPLTFSASGLPTGSTIDETSGLISGPNLHDNQNYAVTVTANAAEACESVSQSFTITFPCSPPTSTPFTAPIEVGTIVGRPYTVTTLSDHFSTDPAFPFTYMLTGLPEGSDFDPTTGVISGVGVAPVSSFTVTITGTTACGTTSQTFELVFIRTSR